MYEVLFILSDIFEMVFASRSVVNARTSFSVVVVLNFLGVLVL